MHRAPASGHRRRAGFVVLDQGLCSASGFLLTLLAARTLPARDFAAFSLLYSGYLVALVGIRGATGDVAAILRDDRAAACRRAVTAAWALAAAAGALAAAAGLVLDLPALVLTGLVLPVLVGQDALRWGAVVLYRPELAVRVDATCLAVLAAAAAVVTRAPGLGGLVLAWGASSAAAVAVGWATVPALRPARRSPAGWLRTTRRHGAFFSAEALGQNGLNTLATSLVAVVAGLPQLALYKAAQLVYGPVSLLLQAGGTFLVSESVRGSGGRPADARRLNDRSALVLGGCVAAVAVVATAVPAPLVGAVFGDTARAARPLLPYMGASLALGALVQVRQSGMRALSRSRLAFGCRIAGVLLIGAALVGGAAWRGGAGAVQVGCAGYAAAALVSWAGFRTALRGPAPAPARPAPVPGGGRRVVEVP